MLGISDAAAWAKVAVTPTCSGIVQTPQEFMETLGQY